MTLGGNGEPPLIAPLLGEMAKSDWACDHTPSAIGYMLSNLATGDWQLIARARLRSREGTVKPQGEGMNTPKHLKYTKTHEWLLIEGSIATVGVTDYAQGELGDVVFVELPAVGTKVPQTARLERSRLSRLSPTCMRRSPAKSPVSIPTSPRPRTWSTRTATARVGWSRSRCLTRARRPPCSAPTTTRRLSHSTKVPPLARQERNRKLEVEN